MKIILCALFLSVPAAAAVPAWQNVTSTATGTSTTYLAGDMKVYTSTRAAAASPAMSILGPTKTLAMYGSTLAFTGGGAITGANYLQLNTSFMDGQSEGRLQWNSTEGVAEIGLAGGNVNLQIGEELVQRCRNTTGSTIANGAVVYITTATSSRPTIALADADGTGNAVAAFGVATEDILGTGGNTQGYVTVFGTVHDINTAAWAEGTRLYLSTTAGTLQANIPPAPARVVYVGQVTHSHASVGSLLVAPVVIPDAVYISSITAAKYYGDGSLLVGISSPTSAMAISTGALNVRLTAQETLHRDILDPTGFLTSTSTTLSLTVNTFTITGTNFVIYADGVKYLKSTESVWVSSTTTGTTWLYYDKAGTLTKTASFPGFDQVLLATVYYSTPMAAGILTDERHGASMPWRTHEYVHKTISTRYASGLAGAFDSSYSTITAGEVYDDDLLITIPQTTRFTVLYKSGGYPYFNFTTSTSAYYAQSAGVLQYNDMATNTLKPVTSTGGGSYVAAWIYAGGTVGSPIVAIAGQREDSSLANARTNNTPEGLVLTGLPMAELKLLYRVILRNAGGTATYVETADYRAASTLPGASVTLSAHNTLSNLTLATAGHPYDAAGGFASYDYAATIAASTAALTTATSANTASQLVKRDASGNFSAGTITAASFNATTWRAVQLNGSPLFSGDATSGNVFMGPSAGANYSSGGTNVAVGKEAMSAALTGSGNVALGNYCGLVNGGSNNISIGNLSGWSMGNGSENIAIGYSANVPASATKYLNIGDAITGYMTAGSTFTFVPDISAPRYAGDGSQLTGIDTKPRHTFATGVAISSEATASLGGGLRLSTNTYIVGFASATKYYGDGSALTGIVSGGGGGVTISTFVVALHSGGDIYLSSAATSTNNPFPNIGMQYVFDYATATITGVKCYTLVTSTIGSSFFNIAVSTDTGNTKTFNFLYTSDIEVSTNTTYSAWVTPTGTAAQAALAYVPAAIGVHVTRVPTAVTQPQEYGCLVRYWRRLD